MHGFDYTHAGSYFVTLVTEGREPLFGEIFNGQVCFSLAGHCAESMLQSFQVNSRVTLDTWVVMPNHVHILVTIKEGPLNRQSGKDHPFELAGTSPRSLSAIVQNYKSVTTRKIHALKEFTGTPIWQRNFYEHIVRDQEDHDRIVEYIRNNPLDWEKDELNLLV
jgi:putative transposase